MPAMAMFTTVPMRKAAHCPLTPEARPDQKVPLPVRASEANRPDSPTVATQFEYTPIQIAFQPTKLKLAAKPIAGWSVREMNT